MNLTTLLLVAGGALAVGAAGIGTVSVLSTAGPLAQPGPPTVVMESPTSQMPPTPTPPPARDAVVATIAGGPALKGPSTDGPPDVARFGEPGGVALGTDGSIYVADFANRVILRIDSSGNTERIAGSGGEGTADGPALSAQFTGPTWLAVDSKGTIYVSDGVAHRIRKVEAGVVTTLAGGGPVGLSEGSFSEGTGADARFDAAAGLAIDALGNLIVADYNNNRIRRVTPSGEVTTIAGTGESGHADGPALEAKFNFPAAVALGPDGSIYVTEHGNNDIRRITPDGQVETVLPYEYERLHHPSGIAVASDGTIYLADTGGARLLELGIDGSFRVVAGTGSPGFADGPGRTAQLDTPAQLEWVAPGTLFFADKANAAVRKVDLR